MKPTINNGRLPLIKCKYLLPITWNESWATIQSFFAMNEIGGKRIRMSLPNMELADFKTWLQSNNMPIYYVMETPTYTEITDSTLISQLETLLKARSYLGQTNITQTNNDLPFIINATALREME